MARIPRLKLGDIVYIKWSDASKKEGEFENDAEFDPIALVQSVGFYVGQNKTHIWFSTEIEPDDNWDRDRHSIPKSIVLEVVKLEKAL